VTLEPSTYSVQWFSVDRRETKGAGKVTVEDHKSTSFTAPFAEAGPAVLYLRRVGALGAPSTFGDRSHRSVGAPRSARSGVLRRPPRSQAVLGSRAKGA
jgi:hypothetical protein